MPNPLVGYLSLLIISTVSEANHSQPQITNGSDSSLQPNQKKKREGGAGRNLKVYGKIYLSLWYRNSRQHFGKGEVALSKEDTLFVFMLLCLYHAQRERNHILISPQAETKCEKLDLKKSKKDVTSQEKSKNLSNAHVHTHTL